MKKYPYAQHAVTHFDYCVHKGHSMSDGIVEPIPDLINKFFDAMDINHAGNRMKVCTGIAHKMTNGERNELIKRLKNDAESDAQHLLKHNAPTALVANTRAKNDQYIKLIERAMV